MTRKISTAAVPNDAGCKLAITSDPGELITAAAARGHRARARRHPQTARLSARHAGWQIT
jgi:hypothetical protein